MNIYAESCPTCNAQTSALSSPRRLVPNPPIKIGVDVKQRYFQFVLDHYSAKFNTEPEKSDMLIAATQNNKSVGSISIDFGLTRPIAFHKAFILAPEDQHLLEIEHVEFGRWISTISKPKISEAMLFVAVIIAMQRNCALGFVEQRLALERILRKSGIDVRRVHARLNKNGIRSADLPFYKHEAPVLNVFRLDQAAKALRPRIDKLLSEKVLTLVDIQQEKMEIVL